MRLTDTRFSADAIIIQFHKVEEQLTTTPCNEITVSLVSCGNCATAELSAAERPVRPNDIIELNPLDGEKLSDHLIYQVADGEVYLACAKG